MSERMQHCFNCGAELGVYAKPSYAHDACTQVECQRAERDAYRQDHKDAQERAREDGYERYR